MAEKAVTVRFYAAVKRLKAGEPWPEGRLPLARMADGLSELTLGPDGNALFNYRGQVLLALVRKRARDYTHIVFYRLRRDQLPDTLNESTGAIDEIALEDDESLAEPTELLFFTNGVVGQLANQHGPGMTLCAIYVEEKTGVDSVMAALLRDDVLQQLRDDDEVSMIAIRVASANVEQLGKAGQTMREAGRSAANAPGTGSIELVYRPERGQKDTFWNTWLPRIRQLVQGADQGTLDKVVAVRRDDSFDRDEQIDLLSARITRVVNARVDSGRRHISPAEAERLVVGAYNSERTEILRALQLATDRAEGHEES